MAERRTAPPHHAAVEGLALFAALAATFEGLHGTGDQWCQGDEAKTKGLVGDHLVYLDGTAVDEVPHRPGHRTMTATALGRRSTTIHVIKYTALQVLGSAAVPRAVGYRVPLRYLAAGAAINAVTHWVIDRRIHLDAAARAIGKGDYLDHCTVQRRAGVVDTAGPGTALMELDQAAHRAIGVAAALVTTALTIRSRRTR